MTDGKKNEDSEKPELTLTVYDPDNPLTEKWCICEIIRDLPELTDEDISHYQGG